MSQSGDGLRHVNISSWSHLDKNCCLVSVSAIYVSCPRFVSA